MNQIGKEKNDSIIVASSILAGAQIVVRIISLLYRIPLIRIVGQEGMGYYANAYEVYQFLLLVSSNGIPVAFSLLSASYLANGEYKNLQRLMRAAWRVQRLFSGKECDDADGNFSGDRADHPCGCQCDCGIFSHCQRSGLRCGGRNARNVFRCGRRSRILCACLPSLCPDGAPTPSP